MINFLVSENPATGLERIRMKVLVLLFLMILIPYGIRTSYILLTQEFYTGELTYWIPVYGFLIYLIALLLAIKIGKPFKPMAWAFYIPSLVLCIYTLYWDNSRISVVYFHMILLTFFGALTIGLPALFVGITWVVILIILHNFVFEIPHIFSVGASSEEFVSIFYLEIAFQYVLLFVPLGYFIYLIQRDAYFPSEPLHRPISPKKEESEEMILARLQNDFDKPLGDEE